MEPLGRGRAEARSRLSVQRRVHRCWARLSSRPAHRRAVPAAPSTDRQLSPQGNMVRLWGPGHSESTWRAGEARAGTQAACSAHLFSPEWSRGLGAKPEGYNLEQGLRSQSPLAVEGDSDHAPLGNVPFSRPERSGLFLGGVLAASDRPLTPGIRGHLPPPPTARTPLIKAARAGKERSYSPVLPTWAVITTGAADPRPTSVSLLPSVNPSRSAPDTFIYILAPSLRTDADLHDVTRPCIFKALHAESLLEVVDSGAHLAARGRAWQPPGVSPAQILRGPAGSRQNFPAPRRSSAVGGRRALS